MFLLCSHSPVDTPDDMTERHAQGLRRLAELSLTAAEALHERVMAAPTAKEAADWGLAFQRVCRNYRQSIALEAKLVRERQRALREDRDDAAKQRTFQTRVRRAKVRSALNQLVWNEYEGDEAEALEMVVGERLDDEELADSFTTEPLDAQIERIRKSIGLGKAAAPETPPDPVLSADYWESSA